MWDDPEKVVGMWDETVEDPQGPGNTVDPHMVGFEGEQFEFMGDDGKYYALISTGTLQVNMRIKSVPNSEFAYVDAMGVKIGKGNNITKIKMGLAMDGDNAVVIVNEQRLQEPMEFETGLIEPNGKKIIGKVWTKENNCYINTGAFAIKLIRKFHDPFMGDIAHMDAHYRILETGVLSDGVMPHGILGQTADFDGWPKKTPWFDPGVDGIPTQPLHGEGVIDGHYKDYEVSTIFAHDFKYNRFGTEPTTTPIYGVGNQSESLVLF